MNRRIATLALTAGVTIAAVALIMVSKKPTPPPPQEHSAVVSQQANPSSSYLVVPELTGDTQAGAQLFTKYCSACHGSVGDGTDSGPPLVHKIYEPSHHPDEAIYAAAKLGARAHHWQFGNMPPVDGITDPEIAKIVAFIRAMQKANGIE